jgi:hypothetical protein
MMPYPALHAGGGWLSHAAYVTIGLLVMLGFAYKWGQGHHPN